MALSEKQLEILGDRITPLYQQLEQDVIADIARRVKKTGRLTETAEIMAKAMMDKGQSPAKIRTEVMRLLQADSEYRKFVANNTKQFKRDAIHAIRQTEKEAARMGNQIIANAGDMSFNKDLALWHQAGKELTKDSAFAKLVSEMSAFTGGTLKNITRTTGFKGAHGYTSIQNAYTNALDRALIKMASGAFSFDQSANECVRELARSGLRTIDYASGRSYQLDTASRMCIRTSCHQLSAQISMQNCDKTGVDLVEVTSHWGAREDHAVWQGKIYSRSGKNKKYPPFSLCHYGAVDGLCGVNCRHTFYPFFEGISKPTQWQAEPVPKEYRGKKYTYTQATQKQRKMERDIRATKREIEAQRVLGGDTKILEAKKRRQIAEYHDFSRKMEISPKDNRLRVVSGTSDVTRTNAYKIAMNSIANAKKNDKIKVGLQFFASKEKQYGKKIGKHAQDFGLDASKPEDRAKMHDIIADIASNKDEIRIGPWKGQTQDVLYFIKGDDVVITGQDGEFITIIKDGMINSERIKNAGKR